MYIHQTKLDCKDSDSQEHHKLLRSLVVYFYLVKKNYFMALNLNDITSKEIMPGYHGKLVHSKTMSIAFWTVEKNAEVPEHSHVNEQIMHVMEGEFEFTLDGVTKTYYPGDIVVIASHKKHSGKALTPCKLMDVFSPAREEYK